MWSDNEYFPARRGRPSAWRQPLTLAALLTAQLLVSGVAVVAVFFGPWIVGPHDPLRSGITLNVTFGVAVGSFGLAVVGSLLRCRRRRSSWWVPVLGSLITAGTALTALDYLGG